MLAMLRKSVLSFGSLHVAIVTVTIMSEMAVMVFFISPQVGFCLFTFKSDYSCANSDLSFL